MQNDLKIDIKEEKICPSSPPAHSTTPTNQITTDEKQEKRQSEEGYRRSKRQRLRIVLSPIQTRKTKHRPTKERWTTISTKTEPAVGPEQTRKINIDTDQPPPATTSTSTQDSSTYAAPKEHAQNNKGNNTTIPKTLLHGLREANTKTYKPKTTPENRIHNNRKSPISSPAQTTSKGHEAPTVMQKCPPQRRAAINAQRKLKQTISPPEPQPPPPFNTGFYPSQRIGEPQISLQTQKGPIPGGLLHRHQPQQRINHQPITNMGAEKGAQDQEETADNPELSNYDEPSLDISTTFEAHHLKILKETVYQTMRTRHHDKDLATWKSRDLQIHAYSGRTFIHTGPRFHYHTSHVIVGPFSQETAAYIHNPNTHVVIVKEPSGQQGRPSTLSMIYSKKRIIKLEKGKNEENPVPRTKNATTQASRVKPAVHKGTQTETIEHSHIILATPELSQGDLTCSIDHLLATSLPKGTTASRIIEKKEDTLRKKHQDPQPHSDRETKPTKHQEDDLGRAPHSLGEIAPKKQQPQPKPPARLLSLSPKLNESQGILLDLSMSQPQPSQDNNIGLEDIQKAANILTSMRSKDN